MTFRPLPAAQIRPGDRVRLPKGASYPVVQTAHHDDGRVVVVYDTGRIDRGGRRVLGSLTPVEPGERWPVETLRSVA